VTLGALRGISDSLYQRLQDSILIRRVLGTAWRLSSRGNPTMCLGLPCKVEINWLSASHRYLRLLILLAMMSLMMEVDELCFINCIAQLMLAIAC
jgi:hypothetical protein